MMPSPEGFVGCTVGWRIWARSAGDVSVMRTAAAKAATGDPAGGAGSHHGGARWRGKRLAAGVCLVALVVAGLLTWVTVALYDSNENRLLQSRTRELGLVLQEVIPTIETPMASAAALADATGGSASKFRQFVAPYVGPGGPFVVMSLWAAGGTSADRGRRPRTVAGVVAHARGAGHGANAAGAGPDRDAGPVARGWRGSVTGSARPATHTGTSSTPRARWRRTAAPLRPPPDRRSRTSGTRSTLAHARARGPAVDEFGAARR